MGVTNDHSGPKKADATVFSKFRSSKYPGNNKRFERTLLEVRTKTPMTVDSVLMRKKKFKMTTTVERNDKEFTSNVDRKVLPKSMSLNNSLSVIELMEKLAWVTGKKPMLLITKRTSESVLKCANTDDDVEKFLKFLDVKEWQPTGY